MMKIRILDVDGKDEVYSDVLKYTYVGDYLYIYTSMMTFREYVEDVVFFQVWTEEEGTK